MYFECNEPGYWIDLGTPPHSVVETGQPAYCLQMVRDSPYGEGYTEAEGSQFFKKKVREGLKAILDHGYPASNGGFTDNQAQYATANAIRFFLAENGSKYMPEFLKDTKNVRAKKGYEKLYKWCLKLLEYGRNPDNTHSITFSKSTLTLKLNESMYEGKVKITLKNLNRGYKLNTSAFPEETTITGFTGESGDTLKISIPAEYAGKSFKLTASGTNKSNQAVLFYYAPSKTSLQRVVTCTYEMTTDRASASMTIQIPEVAVGYGYISVLKTDSVTDMPLPGVFFRVFDEEDNIVAEGFTDENGVFTTDQLPFGDYFCQEAATLPGYILDDTRYPVSLVNQEETVSITATNSPFKGTIRVFKRDTAGEELSGVTFILESSADDGLSWNSIMTRSTGEDGVIIFGDLPINDGAVYRLTEVTTVGGKMLAGNHIYIGKLPVECDVSRLTEGYSYEIIEETKYLYDIAVTVCNTASPELPFTGDNGFLFIIVTSMLMVSLGVFFIFKLKQEVNE